jgi:hypothetical protein
MAILVFAQAASARLDLVRLIGNARKFFEAAVEVLEEAIDGERSRVRLRLESKKHGYSGTFELLVRPASADDRFEAQAAEVRGNATGMALLAEKCGFVWEVTADDATPQTAILNLCGILASVALGPVLPADKSTLYGVRGSMERLEKLLND